MQWSPQQHEALVSVQKWLDMDPDLRPQIFRLFGYAGTGKTTLAIEISRMVDGDCLFGSFTGKAALVMRKKGCHGASTLHSLIYKPRRKNRGDEDADRDIPMWELNPNSALAEADLLIIDECSMVGEDLGADVMSFRKPILVLGDPAQLPPVGGAGFFTNHEPDVMLTEIHRQAADNPIVRIATMIRLGETLKLGTHKGAHPGQGVAIVRRENVKLSSQIAADQILCGKNDSRVTINKRIREQLRAEGKLPAGDHLPVVGDRVICLKNKRDRGLLNGGMWEVDELRDRAFGAKKKGRPFISYLAVSSLDTEAETCVSVPHAFWFWNNRPADLVLPDKVNRSTYDEFDYAYAITCHKSQGSQWDKVVVFDESQVFGRTESDIEENIPARWLYTAVTRAAEAVIIAV
jgi:ATP-dependent exoDNAse (exonuclease V) alpha subunit